MTNRPLGMSLNRFKHFLKSLDKMPNQQGGKNYKKSKHSTGGAGPRLEEAGPDELYGRVIKNLGNLNMNIYCNDNVVRICKVRGSMRKRIWINVGDLVIISLRSMENEIVKRAMTDEERRAIDRGDIVHKIEASLHGKAKKLVGINPKLFMALENADGKVLGELGARNDEDYADDTGGIIFDEEAEEGAAEEAKQKKEGSEEDDESDEEEGVKISKKKTGKAKESKVAAVAKASNGDDFDIDDI